MKTVVAKLAHLPSEYRFCDTLHFKLNRILIMSVTYQDDCAIIKNSPKLNF